MARTITWVIVAVIVLGVGALGAGWYFNRDSGSATSFRAVEVKRGDLLATISATGTVEPEEVVDVGAQVAGQINFFGKDPANSAKTIDYGTAVEEGTILAQIDQSLYASDVDQARAQLDQNKANVERAQADLGQLKAKLDQAQRDWERAQKIGPSEALAQSSYDAYRAGYETTKANVAVGEAAIVQAQKAVVQTEAALKKAERNLSYCTIKSPVKGVIIDRRVNIGQTVVSSLSAPSLFLIAKDLTRVQVWVSVNEADIGTIQAGQQATFTVDAYPGHTFRGTVGKVRLNATMTQNVVTYTVEIDTENLDSKLLPYLTAAVQFEISHRHDVLLVPNAALRWLPAEEQVAPDAREAYKAAMERRAARGGGGAGTGGAPGRSRGGAGGAQTAGGGATTAPSSRPAGGAGRDHGLLWLADGKYVRPVEVRVGLSDGIMTEVSGEGVSEGMGVVTGEQRDATAAAPSGTTNPFAPQMPNRRR